MNQDNPCPNANELRSFWTGTMPESVRAPIRKHLKECAQCQTVIQGLAKSPAAKADETVAMPEIKAEKTNVGFRQPAIDSAATMIGGGTALVPSPPTPISAVAAPKFE